MIRTLEQIVLIFAHCRQFFLEARVDMHMAGRARAATAAKREQLVKTIVTNGFHHCQAIFDLNR